MTSQPRSRHAPFVITSGLDYKSSIIHSFRITDRLVEKSNSLNKVNSRKRKERRFLLAHSLLKGTVGLAIMTLLWSHKSVHTSGCNCVVVAEIGQTSKPQIILIFLCISFHSVSACLDLKCKHILDRFG